MGRPDVVKRHLAERQRHGNRVVLTRIDLELLATAQQLVGRVGVTMAD
jgi:hypothetical protein